MVMPGARPEVLARVMTLLPMAVAATTTVWLVVVEVAGTASVNWVALSTLRTVAPAGMPVPVTTTPATRPAVLATVTIGEVFVRLAPVRLILCRTGPSERSERLAES